MDLQVYYQSKREHRRRLEVQFPDGVVPLVSVENKLSGSKGCSVSMASLDNAARCITEGTHTIATAEDVAAFEATQQGNLRDAQLGQFRTRASYTIVPGTSKH